MPLERIRTSDVSAYRPQVLMSGLIHDRPLADARLCRGRNVFRTKRVPREAADIQPGRIIDRMNFMRSPRPAQPLAGADPSLACTPGPRDDATEQE